MRPSDSNGGHLREQPWAGTHTLNTQAASAAPFQKMCARGREERGGGEGGGGRREGGASTASQEAGGRVAMQMGSIHIANHWSLSALQRKSLFRQNSRN